ncbi:MAG: archease, partial [Candidatus Thermoplasmatota archaeon]
MKKYSFIEHTADIAIRAYGKNLAECFENAAVAMFDIISDTKKVKSTGEYKIELKAD